MNSPLTGIFTPKVRRYVYAAYALAGLVLGCLQIAEVNTGKTPEVLAYIGIALGATAASNAPSPERKVDDQRGQGTLLYVLGVVVLVLLILWLVGAFHR